MIPFHRTKPILDDLTPITLYGGWGGGVVWPLKCVFLEYSSQGANGVKSDQASLSLYVVTLNETLGMAWAAGCTLFLQPFGRGRGDGGGFGDVKTKTSCEEILCFTDDKTAATICIQS